MEEHAGDPADREEAAREPAAFREQLGPEQGMAEVLRLTIGSLARCGIVARAGFAAFKAVLLRNLAQVAAYPDDEAVRERAVAAVLVEIGPETKVRGWTRTLRSSTSATARPCCRWSRP
ncbi:hypothetical protein [Streptomyces sp. NPDC002133]|uniref:hypothetical protein n=1 Tax=Streptomyces sp. NPDC002133 TaxID=3154409 RepID=UPI003316B2F7